MVEGLAEEKAVLKYLVSKSGGEQEVMNHFISSRILELARDGSSWTDLEETAKQEHWLEWLMSMKLEDLGRILNTPAERDVEDVARVHKNKESSVDVEVMKQLASEVLLKNPWCRSSDVANKLGLDTRKACAILKDLMKQGRVQVRGAKAQTKYALAEMDDIGERNVEGSLVPVLEEK